MDGDDYSFATSRTGLATTIQQHVLPRLREVYGDVCDDARVGPEEIAELATLALTGEMDAVLDFVEARARGLSLESLTLDLFAPAARLLGERWNADEVRFADVTVALGLLQRLVQMLGAQPAPEHERELVALVTAPGEQHTLALYILGEIFRSSGWAAHVEPLMSEPELVALVTERDPVMIGFSVSRESSFKRLTRLVAELRRENREMHVMLGGAAVGLEDLASSMRVLYCDDVRAAPATLVRARKKRR